MSIMTAYFVCLLLILLVVFMFKNHNDRRTKLINKIPGPPGLPLIGNLLVGLTPIHELWDLICLNNKMYYPILKLWMGPYAMISICDPDDAEIILTSQKHLQKGSAYTKLDKWLKTGLLTSYGEKWRTRRRILTSAFHFNILKKYLDITTENGLKFVEAIKNQDKETTQYLMPLCSKYTLNIICESAMGVALDEMKKEGSEKYKNAVYSMGHLVIYRVLRPYITDWMVTFLWNFKNLHDETLRTLHGFTNKVLMERKEYHKRTDYKYLKSVEENFNEDENFVYGGRKKRLAMLDLLLSAEMDNLIDEEGIKEEVDTFTFEGHDTTGMSMMYTIMLLAENEEAQKKARAEVTQILNKSGGKIGVSELQELSYLERCIKESLRLYPPVSTFSRYILEDLQLKTYLIPAKTEVFIQTYQIHRNPKFWSDPDKFDPERFLPDRVQGKHPFCYIPFSAGPRNCIGKKFAIMELKSLIALILYNFKLEPIDRTSDMKILFDIVIRPAHPVRTKFIRIRN